MHIEKLLSGTKSRRLGTTGIGLSAPGKPGQNAKRL